MKQTLKHTLYASLLGAIFLTNAVNFHFFTHLFENDDHGYIECDYCTLHIQQENHHSFTLPSSQITFQNITTYNSFDDCNDVIPEIAKRTIITDYFFNKPPPTTHLSI